MAAGARADLLERWTPQSHVLRERFETAEPFPLVILDGFLTEEHVALLLAEFPNIEEMPRSRDYVFADKRELSKLQGRGAGADQLYELLTSPDFGDFLSTVCGEPVFVDDSLFGGGFHLSGPGGYLDMHTDFSVHPEHPTWQRTLNILYYLNEGWTPGLGGELVLRDGPSGPRRSIEPICNRLVIMESNDRTFHGFAPIPDSGWVRRSIASYAYVDRNTSPTPRTTNWDPENASFAKRFAARHWNSVVGMKNRLLGSGTASHRDA